MLGAFRWHIYFMSVSESASLVHLVGFRLAEFSQLHCFKCSNTCYYAVHRHTCRSTVISDGWAHNHMRFLQSIDSDM